MRRTFSFSSFLFGVFVFLHGGFLVRVPDFDPYFLVRSFRPRLLSFFGSVFLYRTFGTLQFFCPASFFITVQPFPVLGFHTSSSASSLLYCLCFSPVLSVSTPPPGFSFVCYVVWFLFVGLLRLLRFQLLILLCFVLCGYSALCSSVSSALAPITLSPFSSYRIPSCSFQSSSTFFRGLRLRLLLPVFLFVFTHATAPVAPPSLPLRFPLAAAAPCALWCGSCYLACCGFSGLWFLSILFLRLPALLLFLLVRTFTGFFPFSSLCFLRLRALPLCLLFLVPCWRFSSLWLLFLLSWCNFPLFECPYCFLW